ncbi:unnamed protein product [Oncorhynchus mykiss]|uniref:Bassoon presynaptic cytomatrix protein n=1 Tax=Oncorhynchus mykiss TaxID=8022 RepID=A0A060XLL9_ONCMY|nr:unnamed protein product [Oncorhynchus mykiss]
MSGGLRDPSPVSHPSPKHQPLGSPRHQALASQQPVQQPPFQKFTNQQQEGPRQMQPQQQKPQTALGSGPFEPTAAKQPGDTKAPVQATPTPAIEPLKHPKGTEETTPKPEKLVEPAIDTKPTQKKGEPITPIKEIKKSRYDETKNSTQDLSRSPQSLSDTGYSSDGISSSHSEIIGLIQEEEMKLSERGISERGSPPSPSEITKLESSMRPLLECKTVPVEERERERGRGRHHREQRPRSLSITPEAYDSDEELEDIVEEEEEDGGDWESKQEHKNSAAPKEEKKDEEDEGYGYQKPKKTHKHISELTKEKRRLSHQSSSFEEDTKSSSDIYKCSAEEGEEGGLGGLRRFKTIELNNTNSYSRDMELNNENDLSLDREPELEMESLTGSPEERSRGEYSSTLPPTTSSYNSGTSPTSISSMEEDSDSSPSRRQRLEDAKQQRKARHRSHGPLLPTIEDSSEEDELREEEELLREQEKMRDLEQQRIRSTARKTKRDKEELRAQRRRERSKTPPSNLSPIEDASPTEELRQAAEMEELHRSSASEYSPQSLDSEAEGYESKLYKSGSEYNLPTFMSLYSPTEKSSTTSTTTAPSSSKPLKSAEEVYEEMMRKAELLQKQQKQQQQQQQGRHNSAYEEDTNGQQYEDEYEYEQAETSYENEAAETGGIYEEIRQTSQNITKMHQSSALELQQQADKQVEIDESTYPDKQLLDTGSAFAKLLEQTNDLLTPGNSPTQLSAPVTFSEAGGRIPDVRVTQHYSKDVHKAGMKSQMGKNGITPVAAATTIAAYGVYSRDAVTIPHTSASQTMTTTQSIMYGRQTGGPATSTTTISNVCSKIAEITQAYSQREVVARRVGESRGVQARESATSSEHVIEPHSPKMYSYYKSSSPPLSPSASPTESPSRSPSRRAEISTQTFSPGIGALSAGSGPTSPVMAQGTQTSQRAVSPRLFRQQSSQHAPYMVANLEPTSSAKPMTVNTATSPLSSPTRFTRQSTFDSYSPQASPPDTPPYHQSPQHSFYRMQKVEKVSVGTSMVTTASTYSRGSMSMDNISLCRISSIPGTSSVEPGQMIHGGSVVDLRTVDLRTATNAAPFLMTAHGMDLTSLATETRKYSSGIEGSHPSTIIQPLIMNLNTQQQPHVMVSTATTMSVTVAASMFISQPQQPMVYGDPLQNRVDLGQGMGSAMCLSQNKPPPTDPSIPKIDAKLEDLSIQQQQLLQQQQKLQQQQQLLEHQLQQHHQMQQQSSVARTISPAVAPDIYGTGGPLELKSKPTPAGVMHLAGGGPHGMMVQMDGAPQGGPVTQLVKTEEGQDAVDLTGGQIKAENQPACCDVVYRLPFGGSCVGGPFSQKPNPRPHSVPPLSYESDQEGQYQEFSMDGHKAYTLPFPGRLQPSMSDTNLAEAGLQSYHSKMDPHFQTSGELAVDLSTMKHTYEGGFLGLGMQYGSYTDLRHGGDITATALPIRRFNSLTNISSDYGYSPRDLANFQESNLAQYSATTAREISRMCAALNSMDRYGSNPELMQYGVGRGTGPGGRLNSMRQNMLYGPDGKPISHTQALTNMINARQASLRAMYPSAMRSADGMTYSTINTPIASTLPITTQPASVLRPLLSGVYRPLPTANMTPVPLASLTRMPVNPRMPMSGQAPYHYPAPNVFPSTTLPTESEQQPINLTQAHLHTQAPGQPQVQPQNQPPAQPQHMQPQFHPQGQHPPQSQPPPAHAYPPTQSYTGPQSSTLPHHPTPPSSGPTETEEERMHRQQEQLLQMERERVELEKLRQLRLQEELERERMELQRHREKEQMLVHREIQELQTIKEQVLQQQQAERENQLLLLQPPQPLSWTRAARCCSPTETKWVSGPCPTPPQTYGHLIQHRHSDHSRLLLPDRNRPAGEGVLYSPVSPVSPHRLLETSLSSGGLNKAHVTPQQKAYTAESPQRHPSMPRPIKNTQRSMSDPKLLSLTTDENTKARLNLYQQQALQSQLAALQQSALRKVKRTLPSPPPEESHLPTITPALPQMYMPAVPSLRAGSRPGLAAKASLLKDLTHELKAVEQESTKLRKQQQELEEEEKEIDAKLRYLELGIHQRKETLVKERERRDMAYLRCMGDPRDYMSDSELNNLRLAAAVASYESNGSQPAPAPQPGTPYQTAAFNQPPYPSVSQAAALPQPTPLQTQHLPPSYQTQGSFPSHTYPQSQPPYPTEQGPGQPPYPTHTSPYPSQLQTTPYQPQADILTVHQRPRQTSLADLEHKMPTNYEVISNPTVVVTTTAQDAIYSSSSGAPPYGQYTGGTPMTNTYGPYSSTVSSTYGHPSTYAQDGLYGPASLEQNIPRNYVMCDDISELTKDGLGGMAADMHRSDGHGGRYMGESGPARGGSSYGRPEDELSREEDPYDHHGRGKSSYHPRGSDTYGRVVGSSSTSMGGGSSYYYDDYTKHGAQRTGVQKHGSKILAPAVMSSKRSKHRKQGMEQKISKFSPIEEARDVEADLASYTMSTSGGGSCTVVSRARKLQDDMAYSLRKSAYEQKRYSYPEEDERMYYTSGRSRSTGYGMDKISSRDYAGYRSRSYERDGDRDRSSYRAGYSRGRPPMRSQYSEEESLLSSMGVHVRASSLGPELYDSRSNQYYGQYGSSHSLPDVQDHMRDLPRTHVYKPDDSYIIDDMHCAVSDSEAYNLGQEETDWFEKPRDLRSGSRHYGSGGHSSSGRSRHVKHTYHDYDEPPEEDLWPQDEYGQARHSSSSRDHRPHGSSSGRHSSTSRHSDEPRSSRSSKGHPKDPSMRHDSRQLSSSGKRGDSRSQGGYHSSDYSRDPSGHHHSQGRSSKSSSSHDGRTSSRKQQDLQGHPSSTSRGQGSSGRSRGQGPTSQQDGLQPGQRTQLQQQPQTSAARQTGTIPAGTTPGGQQPLGPGQAQQGLQAKPGQLGPGQASRQPQAGGALGQLPPTAPVANTPPVTAIGAKAVIGGAAQPAKTPQPPLTGIGSKAAPRPGGIGSAAAGQPGMEGESLLSKVLPGNPAEAAGKLGEAISGFGKKFTSLW